MMRDRLQAFAESLGWVGPAAVGMLLAGVGVVVWMIQLAGSDAPNQEGFPTPVVLQRVTGGVPADLPLAVAVPREGRIVETVVYAGGADPGDSGGARCANGAAELL